MTSRSCRGRNWRAPPLRGSSARSTGRGSPTPRRLRRRSPPSSRPMIRAAMRWPGAGRRPVSSTTPPRFRRCSAPRRTPGPPRLRPMSRGKLAPCGVALPDSRDDLFIAAWRLMGVDPARATERAVTGAADLVIARAPDGAHPRLARFGGRARRRRGLPGLGRPAPGRGRGAAQPRGRRRPRHPLRRAPRRRPGGDRRACRAARRGRIRSKRRR